MPQADILSFTIQFLILISIFIGGFMWTNLTFFNIYFKTKIIDSRIKLMAIYKGYLFKYQLNIINNFVWLQSVLGKK
jgi:hypothetical protein